MSLADKKRSVFTTIGSYISLIEQDDKYQQTDSFSSINNKDDIVPFLLDVLKTVAGTEAIKEILGGLFGSLVDEAEPKLKTALKKQFIQSNADETLGSDFTTNGVTVPVKDIDISGKFKVNPSSAEGNLIYGATTDTFNSTVYDAILNEGTIETFSVFNMKYNNSLDTFQIKPNLSSSAKIGDFFTQYIDDTELINKKELLSAVMDNFYGTLAKNQNKTVEQIYEELLIEEQLRQLMNDDDSFIIAPDKLDTILAKARELVAGSVTYDLGCGLMPAQLDFNNFSDLISNISGSTDPFYIGNQIGATIDESTSGSTTSDLTTENKETIKDGFFQKIINIFTVKMLQAVSTAPQIRVMFGMMSSLQNNGTITLNKPSKDMKNFKTCINCMSKEIMALIAKFIFVIAIAYLIKLLKPVITKVIKEKINQYSEIIISLTGGLSNIKNIIT